MSGTYLLQLILNAPEVEKSYWCQSLIAARQQDGLAAMGPCFDDITKLKLKHLPQKVNGLVGGFPCQATCLHLNFRNVLRGYRALGKTAAWQTPGPSSWLTCGGFGMRIRPACNLARMVICRGVLRDFMLLENVGNLLSKTHRGIMVYLAEARDGGCGV